MKQENYARGMTLFELMMVVAIVAILASIAFPAYSRFTQQTNRTDATKTLRAAAQSLERCYSRTFKYKPCNVNGTLMSHNSTMATPNAFYTIMFTMPDNQDYTLTAVPVAAPQTTDSQCASFTLSSSGQQGAKNSAGGNNTTACWGSN
jgi:type IV pilus assembly protein PilE